jgi:RNA polymerase sigma-70 factor (ECF subfamily)
MKKMMIWLCVAGFIAGAAVAAQVAVVSVETMPPSVVKTVPRAGDTKVDPALKEVRVTFSKDMLTKEMWSWCSQSPETFPEIDKTKIRYLEDRRTCVLPVKLEPGKTYVIWINTQKYNYFKDTNKNSAIPYLLVFQTGK